MMFSIIIPSRTINDFLKENISHLKELDYGNFEVILVLDGEDRENLIDDSRFKVIVAGAKGPGEKRNLGAENASGDILVFLDDDAYPPKDWLEKARIVFESNDIYALGAPAVTPLDASFLERSSGRVFESWLSGSGTVPRYKPMPGRFVDDYPTVNLFIKKEAFVAVKGFSTEFWPGEDTKLCLDLVKKFKKKFLYDPRPVVYHHRRNLFLPHLKQISRYGKHRGQFARIFPENSRNLSYFIPSLFVVGLIIGLLFSFYSDFSRFIYFSVLVIYGIILMFEVIKTAILEKNAFIGLLTGIGIFLTHVVYGLSFIVGLLKYPKLKLRSIDAKTGNYVGG